MIPHYRQRTPEAFGDRYGIRNRHGSYAEPAGDSTVDIVYVATPHPMHAGFLTPGPNVASVIGSEGRIDFDAVGYTQTSFTPYDQAGKVVERFSEEIEGRGMQYQALEVERRVREGLTESPVMPINESIVIMATMDEVRRQIEVKYV